MASRLELQIYREQYITVKSEQLRRRMYLSELAATSNLIIIPYPVKIRLEKNVEIHYKIQPHRNSYLYFIRYCGILVACCN